MKIINIEELPGRVPPKHYDLVGRTIVDESIGAKAITVAFSRMEKTGRCDPHTHDKEGQLFIVLKGEMMFKFDQGETRVKQGQAVFVYPGEVHSNYNVAEGETEYLTVTSIFAS
jgi:quercetin dioxygenase-like cupin family protein